MLKKQTIVRANKATYNDFQLLIDIVIVISVISFFAYNIFGTVPGSYRILIVFLVMVMIIIYKTNSFYTYHTSLTYKSILRGKAWIQTFAIVLIIGVFTHTSDVYSRKILLYSFILIYIFQVIAHVIFLYTRNYLNKNVNKEKAVIIGTNKTAYYIYNKINANPWISQEIVGSVEYARDNDNNNFEEKIQMLGCVDNIDEIIKNNKINSVYIAVTLDSSPEMEQLYNKFLNMNLNVYWIPDIFSMTLVNHYVTVIAGVPVFALSETPLKGRALFLKMIEDRILSFLGLIIIIPFLLIVALAIKLDSKGPVIYKQKRTGWDGREFEIYKFRTMKTELCDTGDEFIKQATKDDQRFTGIGKFLRKTSIDELPQLFNVLKGDMSMVGPRPHAVGHNAEYAKKINAYLARHRIKPGITGLAQVRGFRGETRDIFDMEQRIESDIEYINNWSVWLDLSILIRTLFVLFRHEAY